MFACSTFMTVSDQLCPCSKITTSAQHSACAQALCTCTCMILSMGGGGGTWEKVVPKIDGVSEMVSVGRGKYQQHEAMTAVIGPQGIRDQQLLQHLQGGGETEQRDLAV